MACRAYLVELIQQEQSYGDLEHSLYPAGTKLWRSKCLPSGM